MVDGGSWWFMMVDGGSWRFMLVHYVSLRFMVAHDGSWMPDDHGPLQLAMES